MLIAVLRGGMGEGAEVVGGGHWEEGRLLVDEVGGDGGTVQDAEVVDRVGGRGRRRQRGLLRGGDERGPYPVVGGVVHRRGAQ